MITRRTLLSTSVAGSAALLGMPFIGRAKANSNTPVVDGRRVRRRLSTLSDDDPFFDAYNLAVERMAQEPDDSPLSWIAQGRLHADFCAHSRGSVDTNFFSWHRPYLESFEWICGELIGDPDFALPYWYWSDNSGRLPLPFFDRASLNIRNGNFDGDYVGIGWGPVSTTNYRHLEPALGLQDTPFGGSHTEANINRVLGTGQFRTLVGLVEGDLHGIPHVVTGGNPNFGLGTEIGHMSNGLSPLDPAFWMHHCMVDFIWAMSGIPVDDQLAAISNEDDFYEDMFVNADGSPRIVRVGDTFEMENLSFTYDTLVPELQSDDAAESEQIVAFAQSAILELAEARGLVRAGAEGERSLSEQVQPEAPVEFGLVNSIVVPTENLLDELYSDQLVPRRLSTGAIAFGVDSRRVYAELSEVAVSNAGASGAVKVFVDCPYLSRSTPTNDPHFAGNLSFFGCSPDTCGSKSFIVDVTEPLQHRLAQGAVPADVNIQLLPYDSEESPLGEAVAEVQSVRLILA